MNNKQNYYDLLELNKNASFDDIKKSYKKLALKYHPDRNYDNKEENENKFKEITEAHNVLSDEKKRKDYDYFGNINTDFQNNQFDDIISKMFKFSDNDINDMIHNNELHDITPKIFVNIQKGPLNNINNDIFSNITNLVDDLLFGENIHKTNNTTPPINIQNNSTKKQEYDLLDLNVDLNDVIHSNKKTIKYKIKDICSYCNGTCAVEPSDLIQCLYCNGNYINCKSCNGTGSIFKTNRRCINCKDGLYQKNTEISIAVPIGVPNNYIFVLKNKGSYNKVNKNYNHIKIKFIYNLEKNIQVHGTSIFVYIDIKLKELFCGFEKKIKLSKNDIEISIDKYFDPTEAIVYKNMGMPHYKNNNTIGDLIIKFNIIYPKNENEVIQKYNDVLKKIFEKM
jgi:DnaJ-class molecular chaperone